MFKKLYSVLSGLTDTSVFATKVVKHLSDIEIQGHTSNELSVDKMAEIRDRFTQYIEGDLEALHKLVTVKDRLVVDGDNDIEADVNWLLKGMTFKQMNYEQKNGLTRSVTINRSAKGASIKSKTHTIKDFLGKK